MRHRLTLAVTAAAALGAVSASAANKDMERLYVQIAALQSQISDLQKSADDSLFLTKALSIGTTPTFKVDTTSTSRAASGTFDKRAVVVLNDTIFPPAGATVLKRYVERGGGLLVIAGDRTTFPSTEAELLPGKLGAAVDRTTGRRGSLGFLDYSHPVMQLASVVEHHGDGELMSRLVPRLLEAPIEVVAQRSEHRELYRKIRRKKAAFAKRVQQNARTMDRVVLVDLSGAELVVVHEHHHHGIERAILRPDQRRQVGMSIGERAQRRLDCRGRHVNGVDTADALGEEVREADTGQIRPSRSRRFPCRTLPTPAR